MIRLGILFFMALQLQAATTPDPKQLLERSDRPRGAALGGISWNADVASVDDGTASQVSYHVRVKGSDALAEATAPPRSKGEVILFNDRNLWYFKPGLRKPVSIAARQKLMGQASNGDIASTNYARDYEGKVVGEESARGKPSWKLELKARARNVTYDRIRYWISKADGLGIQAEFLTVGGKSFKRAEFDYGNQLSSKGGKIPFLSEMRIFDASNAANHTTVRYVHPKEEPQAASLFNVNNLVR